VAVNRVPIYELHIRPLFRLIDREHMKLFFDLTDYDALKKNAPQILPRLHNGMPPASTGGPWPAELIDMFQRWVDAGFPRLTVGTGSDFLFTKSGTSYHVECNVQAPNDTTQCWLDIVDVDPAHRGYRIYIQPNGDPPSPTSINVSDDFDDTANITSVTVIDAAGSHTVPVSVA
jgi:hypothetical protein